MIAGKSRIPTPLSKIQNPAWIDRIDGSNGRHTRKELDAAVYAAAKGDTMAVVQHIDYLDDGSLAVVTRREKDRLTNTVPMSALVLTKDAQPSLLVDVSTIGEAFQVNAVRQLDAKSYLLAGGWAGNGRLLKLKCDGQREWEKDFKANIDSKFMSVEAASNGKLFMAGISLALGDSKSRFRPYVWLVACNNNGEQMAERCFSGRYAGACRVDGVGYVVLYDNNLIGSASEWHVKCFSDDLNELWDKRAGAAFQDMKALRCRLCHTSSGFIVSGVKDYKPWFVAFGKLGDVLWEGGCDGVGATFANLGLKYRNGKCLSVMRSEPRPGISSAETCNYVAICIDTQKRP